MQALADPAVQKRFSDLGMEIPPRDLQTLVLGLTAFRGRLAVALTSRQDVMNAADLAALADEFTRRLTRPEGAPGA